ncbi:hypothetical protein BJ912DRAFT_1069162 [Pholiota molesta]|nr:hypothetical protein BJ912DRAFT_1071677 [Pholiota molesta]KAF8161864.1 hypothetical protein BJ912DRAFT_1069162 [Pholiota molesta]
MAKKNAQNSAPGIVLPTVPNGFSVATGPDDKEYLVPDFLLPALQQEFDAWQMRVALGVPKAPAAPLQTQDSPFEIIGEGHILYPPDPPLTEQELLSGHGAVVALQHKFGISYKDAAHRLYMAQVEHLKVSDGAYKAIKSIDNQLEDLLRDLNGK